MFKIYAIVVTWCGWKWYDKCLGSLRDSDVPLDIIVIDNASGDGSVEYIREHFPDVILLPQSENLGFAKANNIGIRYAIDHDADYVFLLNQDAWLNGPSYISEMLRAFEKYDKVGIVCPVNMNGLNSALEDEYAIDMPGKFVSDYFMGSPKAFYETNYINAAAWLMNSSCLKIVGGFDTNMFIHYGEDNNYCQRVVFHGFKIMISTASSICHDKESRRGKEAEYRNMVFKQDDLSDRIMWNNILLPIDIDDFILQAKKSIKRSITRFHFRKARILKQTLSFYENVKYSREMNIKGGEVWL